MTFSLIEKNISLPKIELDEISNLFDAINITNYKISSQMKESKILNKTFQKTKLPEIKEVPSQFSAEQKKKIIQSANLNTSIFINWSHQQLQQLIEISKLFSFTKSTVLARKDEIVDYFGIILSGNAISVYDDSVQAELDPYQMIGYMAFMGLKGTLTHFFDIICQNDGIILTIRISELKAIQSKFPQLFLKLSDLAASKCIQVIRHQYSGDNFTKQIRINGSVFTEKRINELFDTSGNQELKCFWQGLEFKEKLFFSKSVKFVEMSQKDIVLNKDIIHSSAYIIMKGQCLAFENDSKNINNSNIITQGTVYGVQNFVNQKPFECNLYCRQKGIFILITKKIFQRILRQRPALAISLYTFLVKEESKNIKRKFQVLTHHQTDQFFIQINLKKKRVKQSTKESENMFSPFLKTYDIIPLHENQFYKETIQIIKDQKLKNLHNQKIKQLNKLDLQHTAAKTKNGEILKQISNQKLKLEDSKQKLKQYQKNLMTYQSFFAQKKSEFISKSGNKNIQSQTGNSLNLQRNLTEQEQEQNTKRLTLLENENNQLRNQTQVLKIQIANLKSMIKINAQKVIETQTRIKKMQMHKQLLKRRNDQNQTISINTKKTNALSLKDVFSQQLKQNKIYRLVAKCAYKWLYQTRKKLKQKNKNLI